MRLLLVEDDVHLGSSLSRSLGEAGINVVVVRDGRDAMAAARSNPVDVIVLDVMLPGRNGFDVCRALRARRVGTPVLMLTARDAVDDRVTGLEAGADDYLVKPFVLKELIARLRALARRHLDDRSAVLTAGRITLETVAHRCRVGDRTVVLTAREYAILEQFMHNPGRLITRGQILDSVWGFDVEGGGNLVEVYISRIRHKLVAAGGVDPLVTLRGAGYRLEVPA